MQGAPLTWHEATPVAASEAASTGPTAVTHCARSSQAGALEFCALLWMIDIHTLAEGVAWCRRHRG